MHGRIRQLKPELFLDDEFWALQQAYPELPLLQGFLGLWCQVDREGRFEWRPAMLKTQILPYWSGDLGAVLDVLRAAGLVHAYEVGGRRYGLIRSFLRHQRPNNREPQSCIPEPLEHAQAESVSVLAHAEAVASAPRASRPPLPTTDSQLPTPTPTPTPTREARPDAAPASGARPTYPGPLQPSKREQQREAEAAQLGTIKPRQTGFDPNWDPNEEHQARGHELGLTDEQILDRAEHCRRKFYPNGIKSENDQFFRELSWLRDDLAKQRFQEQQRNGRDKFENPGRERAAAR